MHGTWNLVGTFSVFHISTIGHFLPPKRFSDSYSVSLATETYSDKNCGEESEH